MMKSFTYNATVNISANEAVKEALQNYAIYPYPFDQWAEDLLNAAMMLIVFAKAKGHPSADISADGVNQFCADTTFRLGVLDWIREHYSKQVREDRALLGPYLKWAVHFGELPIDTRSSLCFMFESANKRK